MKIVRGFGFKAGDCGALDTIVSRDTQDSKDSKDSKSGTLALIERPLRALEQGEVLLRNLACALNPVDYKLLDFFGAAQEGQIMGLDGVGVVMESRSEAVELVGIYAYHADLRGDGSFGDLTILPEKALLPLDGHSALSDKSGICKCGFVASPLHLHSDFRLRTAVARPQSSLENPQFLISKQGVNHSFFRNLRMPRF